MRFYISVTNSQWMYVVEPSEYLISYQLDIESTQTFFSVVFYVIEQISIIIMHDYAQILTSILDRLVGSDDIHDELPVQHWNYLDLPVLVLRVLEHFFYGNKFSGFYDSTLVNFAECPLANETQNLNIITTKNIWRWIKSSLGFETHFVVFSQVSLTFGLFNLLWDNFRFSL